MLTADEQHHIDRVLDPASIWAKDCDRLRAIIKRLDEAADFQKAAGNGDNP